MNIRQRWIDHKTPSKKSKGTVLARAFKKYGNDSFEFSVLEECSEDQLDEREMYYIRMLKPAYNMNEGGTGNKGHHLSKEVKERLSTLGKMQWEQSSPAHKQFIVCHNLKGRVAGYHFSQLQKEHLRQCARQQFANGMSDEQKAKISHSNKTAMRGNRNGNKSVLAISLCGSGFCAFNSIKYAAQRLECTSHEISDVLHGRRKSTHGFIFEII